MNFYKLIGLQKIPNAVAQGGLYAENGLLFPTAQGQRTQIQHGFQPQIQFFAADADGQRGLWPAQPLTAEQQEFKARPWRGRI